MLKSGLLDSLVSIVAVLLSVRIPSPQAGPLPGGESKGATLL